MCVCSSCSQTTSSPSLAWPACFLLFLFRHHHKKTGGDGETETAENRLATRNYSSPPLLGDVILCNVKMEAERGLATGE